MNKEEIGKAKEELAKKVITSKIGCEDYPNCICMKRDLATVIQYIDQLEGFLEKISKQLDNVAIDQIPIAISELQESNIDLDRENNRLEKIEFERDIANNMVDEMAVYINNLDTDEDICSKVKVAPCYNDDFVPASCCIECIKQYFKKKVEGK